MNKLRVSLYLVPKLKNDIEALAREKGISQNALISLILKDAIEKEQNNKPQGK